ADKLIDQAVGALQTAKSMGRNFVASYGQFLTDFDNNMAYEQLFNRTLPRDVMTPCSVFLQPDELLHDAADLLQQTGLEAIPVIDSQGQLLGSCELAKVIS